VVYFPRSGGKTAPSQRRRIRKICVVTLQVAAVCLVKIIGHAFGIERISLNPLFSALVASTVFLLGFLLNGVLTDFKESEKIPAEIATALQSLNLEIQAITAYHPEAVVGGALAGIARLGHDVLDWLGEALSFEELLASYRHAHGEVVDAAVQFKGDASTLRGRLMQDMAIILQRISRAQTIRATKFVPLVYWMADIACFLLFAGLVLAKTNNILESVFFLAVISFLLLLLLRLIDDIDNPFGHADNTSAENVSTDLLEDTVARLRGCSRAF
jgi:predicted membrane chloride channel (bestrophin family)